MNKLVLIVFFLLSSFGLLPASKAGTAQNSTVHTFRMSSKMSSFNLSFQQWKNRVLLVFAPSITSSAYQQQMQLLQDYNSGFADRDLILVQVLAAGNSYANGQPIDEPSVSLLRDRFNISKEDFRVVLVGKDGGVKRRDATPVQATAIFNEIDAMPMRQQEMKERGK
ncbi:MAG: DUF4174 domain-containing protein [Heteroscytonema crispum UTEX LB 1556]